MAWLIISDDNDQGPRVRADQAIMYAHWAY